MAQPAVVQPVAVKYGEKPSISVVAKPNITTTLNAASAKAASGNSADGGVRLLGLHEYKQAARTLAEAFKDDHVAWYFLETPDRAHWTKEQQWDLHVQIFEYIVYAHLLKGIAVTAGPNHECVALW